MDSIYDLWNQIRQHPDFAGGALFVRADVAQALFHADYDEYASEEEIAAVTPEMMRQAGMAIESYIYYGTYTWVDALRDCIDAPVALPPDEAP